MRALAYIVPTLLILWFVDSAVSEDRRAGWERNTVRNSDRRWEEAKGAKVAILGSSTSADWLPEDWLAKLLGRKKDAVLDAHINGCHQPCTWSEVRQLLARGRHFDVVFFGTNLFQQCEFAHSKRQLQDTMMVPTLDVPRLFGLYLKTQEPLNYMARFLGMEVSGVYGDTEILQQRWRSALLGAPKEGQAWRWATQHAPPPAPVTSCSYAPDEVRYKTAVTEALLDDLGRLSDRVYFLLLPDATLAELGSDPKLAEAWQKHRALHAALVAERPFARFIDLTGGEAVGGAWKPEHFRDGTHLSGAGMKVQRALFEKLMRDGGYLK